MTTINPAEAIARLKADIEWMESGNAHRVPGRYLRNTAADLRTILAECERLRGENEELAKRIVFDLEPRALAAEAKLAALAGGEEPPYPLSMSMTPCDDYPYTAPKEQEGLKPDLFWSWDDPEDGAASSLQEQVERMMDYGSVEDEPCVLHISVAATLPDIWVCAEWPKDGELTFTEHATQAEAEAALPTSGEQG